MTIQQSAVAEEMKPKKVALDPGNMMLLVYTLVIALIILCGGLLQANASEQPPQQMENFKLDDIRQGELLVQGEVRLATTVLRLDQDFSITVSGIAALVRVF